MIRKDIIRIDIQDNLYFLIFHKIINGQFGSALAIYIYDIEYLKFDCLGQTGHYHVDNKKIFFKTKLPLKQIDLSIIELNKINDYFKLSNNQLIKNFIIDIDEINNKKEFIKNKMIEYEGLRITPLIAPINCPH